MLPESSRGCVEHGGSGAYPPYTGRIRGGSGRRSGGASSLPDTAALPNWPPGNTARRRQGAAAAAITTGGSNGRGGSGATPPPPQGGQGGGQRGIPEGPALWTLHPSLAPPRRGGPAGGRIRCTLWLTYSFETRGEGGIRRQTQERRGGLASRKKRPSPLPENREAAALASPPPFLPCRAAPQSGSVEGGGRGSA